MRRHAVTRPYTRLRYGRLNSSNNTCSDLVRIGGGVRPPVFEVSFPAILNRTDWNTDRSTAVGYTEAELVDRLCLMKTGQTKVVVCTVYFDVLPNDRFECAADLFKDLL